MQLAIVQRGKFATFELLTRTLADDPGTRVIWDRRLRDRRKTTAAPDVDRRRSERRGDPSVSWDDCQYVILNLRPETSRD